ncbi:hypothetical protein PV04_06832 [Phialophora macrospora]|uniref:Uncharacterized protein n=1 Tax=Phialophora macrospora TaxID=1851006 RepID=A0A0D2G6M1_9EURO|nr:hypothetical protein PV04_06832 [Phialophora macrospora]
MALLSESQRSSASSGTSIGMIFIVSSTAEKASPATRKLIRSHVMQGNKQKKALSDGSKRWAERRAMSGRIRTNPVTLEEGIRTYAPLFPGRVGSDLSFVEFADAIEPSMLSNWIKFSTFAGSVVFPLMAAIGLWNDNSESLYSMATDAAFLHFTAFAVEGFIQRILRGQEDSINTAASLHFQKGLRLLRKRLLEEDDEKKLSDSTISAVLKLASTSHFDGDCEEARQHMAGLRRMVDLRGGLDIFKGTKLVMEMLRSDLRIALLDDSNPVFFRQSSEPVGEYPKQLLPAAGDDMSNQDNFELIRTVDKDLATAWWVMRKFCLLVNLGTQTQRPMYPKIIYETMVTVMYRLLHVSFAAGSVDEAIRLGLLAFCHHVFLQWQDVKLPRYRFLTTYRNCIVRLKLVIGVSSKLMLWLLMTGANSLFEMSEEPWLRDKLRECVTKCEVKAWKGMEEILRSFMWIELLDERPSKQIYASLHLGNGES